MKKLKIFTEGQPHTLEHAVNHWLSENTAVTVLSSDLKVIPGNPVSYAFYLLYAISTLEEEGKLQTLAVVDQTAVTADSAKVVEVITSQDTPLKN